MIRTATALLLTALLTTAVQAADAPALAEAPLELDRSLLILPAPIESQPLVDPLLPEIEVTVPPQLPRTIDLTSAPDDLFARIRRGFSMPNLHDDLVLRHQSRYLDHPEQLRRMVERGRPYLHFIVSEIEKRGLPTELALLPMVESAFNPMAYSRSHAAGLWQFIPGTGRAYDLEQNWWVDERRDVLSATHAALDYLTSIYQMHGDWQLALASYNWGEGAVGRALEKNRVRDLPLDYPSLKMPAETRNYVPKLQALKNIFSSPELLARLDIPHIPDVPYFEVVEKPADMDLSLAARLAEMHLDDFVALNPAHRRPLIKADLPIVLPTDRVDTFRANLAAHAAPLASWSSHTLAAGEQLDTVARRYGISVAALKAQNGLSGRRPKISRGMTLLVPARLSTTDAPARLGAIAPQPRQAREATQGKTTVARYTVRRGDTLFSIARRHGVDVEDLERLNPIRGNALKPGMTLRLSAADAPRARSRTARYVVKRGDTAHAIARQFKIGVDDLMRQNGLTPDRLQPGQTLTVVLAQNHASTP